jgi:hypothetical protein
VGILLIRRYFVRRRGPFVIARRDSIAKVVLGGFEVDKVAEVDEVE